MQLCAIFSASLACGDLGLTHRLAPVADLGGEPSMSAPGGPNCAVVSGAAKCWGDGFGGKLGNGSDASVSTPTTVTGLGQGVTKIAIGDFQVCAIVNAAVKCWGSLLGKERTQLGTPNSNVPVDVPNLTSGVTDIAAGSTFTCAIINGGVSCWGWDVKVGTGTDLDKDSSWDPVPVPGLESGVTSLSAGRGHICAIASGLLKCWGANSLGQLGTGGTISGLTPQTVVAPGPTIHAKLQKKVGAGLRADYGSSVYVHVAYSIPKHVQVKGACDARVTITMTGDGFSPRKGNTKFKRSASGCGATWQFATPATASDEVNIAVRSRGNWLLRPSVLKTTATYCEDRECP
jgi:hypothetical protein